MDNDHGITGELREWAEGNALRAGMSLRTARDQALAIADRIDAEHERAVMSAMNDALYHANDENMAKHGWVRLPKDADGEYIHIGDMMENGERVARIVLTDGSWDPSVYTAKTPNQLREYFCHEISHYHAPTVEDVLRDYASRILMAGCIDEEDELVDEYAAKLQLREDA